LEAFPDAREVTMNEAQKRLRHAVASGSGAFDYQIALGDLLTAVEAQAAR
jgi:hypothetical protein